MLVQGRAARGEFVDIQTSKVQLNLYDPAEDRLAPLSRSPPAGNAWPIQASFCLEWGCFGPSLSALCHIYRYIA
jgi:hypothetical protein